MIFVILHSDWLIGTSDFLNLFSFFLSSLSLISFFFLLLDFEEEPFKEQTLIEDFIIAFLRFFQTKENKTLKINKSTFNFLILIGFCTSSFLFSSSRFFMRKRGSSFTFANISDALGLSTGFL